MLTTDNSQTLVNALAEIERLKAQLKTETDMHESWQNQHLIDDGDQCRQIRQLELRLAKMTDSRDAYQEAADKLAIELKRLRDERDVELEAELGDLPRAQAEMMATIKEQRRVLKEAWGALLLPSMKTESMLRQHDQTIAAIWEVLK